MSNEPSVWLGCLACYNAGRLVGEWMSPDIAATATPEEVHARPADRAYMERDRREGYGEHEELWVMDHECVPLTGEFGPLECQAIADAYDAVGADEWDAYLAYAGLGIASDPIPDADDFREAYSGEWDSEEDYAYDLAEELGAVPAEHSWPASYIDWEAATRDLFMDYSSERSPGGGVFVFRNY